MKHVVNTRGGGGSSRRSRRTRRAPWPWSAPRRRGRRRARPLHRPPARVCYADPHSSFSRQLTSPTAVRATEARGLEQLTMSEPHRPTAASAPSRRPLWFGVLSTCGVRSAQPISSLASVDSGHHESEFGLRHGASVVCCFRVRLVPWALGITSRGSIISSVLLPPLLPVRTRDAAELLQLAI